MADKKKNWIRKEAEKSVETELKKDSPARPSRKMLLSYPNSKS